MVRCTDFFRANGTAYLVMEYIEGLPLSELLKQREAAGRPFEESDLRMLAILLLETLSRLHSAGASAPGHQAVEHLWFAGPTRGRC